MQEYKHTAAVGEAEDCTASAWLVRHQHLLPISVLLGKPTMGCSPSATPPGRACVRHSLPRCSS
jgi:hypothetical protein